MNFTHDSFHVVRNEMCNCLETPNKSFSSSQISSIMKAWILLCINISVRLVANKHCKPIETE